MVYCRFHRDVVGSSNLRDITNYCKQYHITYLTTCDFLYHAILRHLLTKEEADKFITEVNGQGSKVPVVDFDAYACTGP